MNLEGTRTPVAVLLFKRPDMARQVLQAVAQARPSLLLVVGDGPKADSSGDLERVLAARAVVDEFDWDCPVLTNYAETNLGLRQRIISGLNWIFQNTDEAIILEEDCIPHPTFFRFCDELLEHYREDRRIMAIGGVNYQFSRNATPFSYYFSIYNHVSGWASWRRAWACFEEKMESWPYVRESGLLRARLHRAQAVRYWSKRFQSTYEGKIDSWAYTWTYTCWVQNGLTILPSVNMITNIGSGLEAAHSHGRRNPRLYMPAQGVEFPLLHPTVVLPHSKADKYTQNRFFRENWLAPVKLRLKKWLEGK